MSAVFATTLLGGCADKAPEEIVDEEEETTVVFRFGDSIVTIGEIYIYVNTVSERYELQYGQDVWKLSLPEDGEEQTSMEELTREEIINQIIKVKTLVAHSSDYGVALSDAEQEELRNVSKTFYEGLTDEDILQLELTEDRVYQVLSENMISGKVQQKLLENDPVEISDEDARMTTFFDMYFACYSIDKNGKVKPFTKEEKDIQYENALQACSTLGTASIDDNKDADSIEKLVEYYKLDQAGEQTLSPEEILEIYGKDIYDMLYSMDDGTYSTVVESEYGYHVFQMISRTDRKATKAKKEQMTQDEMELKLSTTLNNWKKEIAPDFVYPDSIRMDIYETIKF